MQRTEPMHIGSPTSSSGRHQNPFLPPFLMGNSSYSSPLTPNSKAWGLHPSPACSSLNRSSANQNSTIFLNDSTDDAFHQDVNVPARSPGRRMNGGPPVKGLFEILPSCGTLPFKLENNDSHLTSAGRSLQLAAALNDSHQFNQGINVMSPNCDWFPTTTESFILQEFSSFGNIVKHLVPPEGNWMHVQFQNKIQARKALSRHCRVLPGNIMIGVKHCIDKAVLDLNKENFGVTMKPTCMNSPAAPPVVKTGFEDLHQSSVHSSSIRHLASATQAHPSPIGLKRKGSIVSNAIGYVFGF